ncbi:MAG TPA: ACT domain-containing protein, partial [Caldithrix sp.]|nr:ACT domain-containing protein [Caldithrix sp.]
MPGETNLSLLIQNMQPELLQGEFVFVRFNRDLIEAIKFNPICTFNEKEGLSLILNRDEADLHKIQYESVFKMITLNIHSSLEAVGFLARITHEFAKHNISVNPVSAYYHDHLFVPAAKTEEAMYVLQ